MAYDFRTAEENGIPVAWVAGERHSSLAKNFEELWAFWSGVASDMKQHNLHRLLAVISAQEALRSLDVPTFYRRLGEMGFLANMRLAVVVNVPPHERPVLQLGVNAAAKDGWNICLFWSESEAREWLLQG